MNWLKSLFGSRVIVAANEKALDETCSVLVVANESYDAKEGSKDNWVLLAPFGDHPNQKGLQRFDRLSANSVVEHWKSLRNVAVRKMGLPWYVGHPDIPEFRERYKDAGAVGRIKDLAVGEEGLMANVWWNERGKALIANAEYHGHSVAWYMRRAGDGSGWNPFALRSVGFTNEPNIPVPPITAANEKVAMNEEQMQKLAKACGLPEAATFEQILETASRMQTSIAANEQAGKTCEQELGEARKKLAGFETKMAANEKAVEELREANKTLTSQVADAKKAKDEAVALVANERRLRAAPVIDQAMKEGRFTPAERKAVEVIFVNESWEKGIEHISAKKPNAAMNAQSSVNASGRRGEVNAATRNKTEAGVLAVNEMIEKNPNMTWDQAFARVRAEKPELFTN